MSDRLNRAFRRSANLVCLLLGGFALESNATASVETPATQPAISQTVSQNGAQSDNKAQLAADWHELGVATRAFEQILGDQSALSDASSHARLLTQLKPLYADIQRWYGRYAQLRSSVYPSTQPNGPADKVAEDAAFYIPFKAPLIAVGDTEVIDQTTAQAKSADDHLAKIGQLTQLVAEWMADPDQAAQAKTRDRIAGLLRTADVNDRHFELALLRLLYPQRTLPPDRTDALLSLVKANYQSGLLTRYYAHLDQVKKDKAILATVGNKPLTLAGTTVDGKSFSTEQWKGKVILVDFWASWCGPCKAELPRVKAMYQKYHDQGLEVLGVSNDYKKEQLEKYLAADPGLAWPCLFDEAASKNMEWNPLTLKCGISGIPTMFLIDRTGICRTVDAVQNMDTTIPKLLAEPEQAISGAVEQSKMVTN